MATQKHKWNDHDNANETGIFTVSRIYRSDRPRYRIVYDLYYPKLILDKGTKKIRRIPVGFILEDLQYDTYLIGYPLDHTKDLFDRWTFSNATLEGTEIAYDSSVVRTPAYTPTLDHLCNYTPELIDVLNKLHSEVKSPSTLFEKCYRLDRK